jgi:membrane dipeptidase
MLLIDAHEDIAWNALTFNRDVRRSAAETRQLEVKTATPGYNGNTLLGKEDWISGEVAVIFATLFASPAAHSMGEWDMQSYRNTEQAHQALSAQLDYYHKLTDVDQQFRLIDVESTLDAVLKTWEAERDPEERLIGLVPLMEGADGIRAPEEVYEWYERGLRIIALAWSGSRYSGGTHEPGPITSEGFALMESMADLGMILDLSHLSEQAYFQAVEQYPGVVIASHSNPRRFLPTVRGLSDEMIALLAERDGVIGIVPFNRFMKPGWTAADHREEVTLNDVASAIDHVCQITGSVKHVGIGSDFDGGFGVEQTPVGIDTVADLQKLVPLLAERGYDDAQVADIFSGNWIRILRAGLPD